MPHRVARRTIAIVGLPVALWWLQPWKLLITLGDGAAPFESRILRRERMIHRTAGRR